jgi:hypothetical protein
MQGRQTLENIPEFNQKSGHFNPIQPFGVSETSLCIT